MMQTKKMCTMLAVAGALFSAVSDSQAQIIQSRSGIFFEMRGMKTDFDGDSLSYTPDDATEFSGFNVIADQRNPQVVLPTMAITEDIVLWDKLLFRFDWSIAMGRKQNNYNFGFGMGYQQSIGKYSRVPVYLRLLAVYEYWNYGYRIATYEQPDNNLKFGNKVIKADEVNIFMGNRRHSIRPHLGISVQVSPIVEIAIEGYYNFPFADQSRVFAQGKTFWPKRAGLPADDDRLRIYDDANPNLPINKWDAMDRWGARIGIIYKTPYN